MQDPECEGIVHSESCKVVLVNGTTHLTKNLYYTHNPVSNENSLASAIVCEWRDLRILFGGS